MIHKSIDTRKKRPGLGSECVRACVRIKGDGDGLVEGERGVWRCCVAGRPGKVWVATAHSFQRMTTLEYSGPGSDLAGDLVRKDPPWHLPPCLPSPGGGRHATAGIQLRACPLPMGAVEWLRVVDDSPTHAYSYWPVLSRHHERLIPRQAKGPSFKAMVCLTDVTGVIGAGF